MVFLWKLLKYVNGITVSVSLVLAAERVLSVIFVIYQAYPQILLFFDLLGTVHGELCEIFSAMLLPVE